MSTHRYLWRASVSRVVDGDTLDVVLDAGFRRSGTERVRVYGVNCPEVKGETRPAGLAATAFTTDWIANRTAESWPFVIETFKTDVFGRYLARVWPAGAVDGPDLSQALLDAGHAVPFIR